MKSTLIVFAVIVVVVAGLSFYMGWFRLSSDSDDNNANVTVTVDKDQIQEDKDKLQDLGQ